MIIFTLENILITLLSRMCVCVREREIVHMVHMSTCALCSYGSTNEYH